MTIQEFFSTSDQNLKLDFIKEISANPETYLPQIFAEGNKNCAYALSILSKKTTLKDKYLSQFEKAVKDFANSQDPKIRKYAFVIVGNLDTPFCQEVLASAVKSEQTFYTLSSLMLSLGNRKDLADELMQRVESQKEEIAPKIYDMIVEGYQKVNPPKVYECTNLNFDKEDCLIITQKCYEDILCQNLPFKKQKTKKGIICKGVTYAEYLRLCERRDLYEVLICAGDFDENGAILGGLEKLSRLVGDNIIGYRICCQDKVLASRFISQAKKLNFPNLINSPSNYSFTINIVVDTKVSVFVKAENFKCDFSYRTQFLPASINPTTASIIANIANEYNPNAKSICDPFCGTATMLVERFLANPNIEIFGSDINREAIEKARENLSNAKIRSHLKVLDIARFTQPCDEIISNLPYGLRVGSHSANAKIYSNLVKVCSKNLTIGGFAFLYTADKKLLRDLIKKSSLTLLDELNFISGGLYCSLFVVKKEN